MIRDFGRFIIDTAHDPVFWLIQTPAYGLAAVAMWDRYRTWHRRWLRHRAWQQEPFI